MTTQLTHGLQACPHCGEQALHLVETYVINPADRSYTMLNVLAPNVTGNDTVSIGVLDQKDYGPADCDCPCVEFWFSCFQCESDIHLTVQLRPTGNKFLWEGPPRPGNGAAAAGPAPPELPPAA
jgi:hypothetical protein